MCLISVIIRVSQLELWEVLRKIILQYKINEDIEKHPKKENVKRNEKVNYGIKTNVKSKYKSDFIFGCDFIVGIFLGDA